ncbi:MAG: AmmeMemoRadiSam system protein A [Epsilonproteobacteria bacterium]|nr:AmmeMemoRadiSam system protein A [Campylobacterota bacterium]
MKILLKIARAAILEEFEGKKLINRDELLKEYPFLSEERATFVTLKIDGILRGCIGSILPRMPLIDDVIYNAKQAAFHDPRFPPLTPQEYEHIHIEISLLSIPYELPYTDVEDLRHKIRPNIDGVILVAGNYQATFLPSVWEEIDSFDLFFAHLCQKAGLEYNCLEMHPTIYVYQAQKIEE